jgi:glycosyltransferase involved in cell wall biosynthesis
MGPKKRVRIAILTNIIPDYRLPIFAALANDDAFDVRIFLSLPLDRSSEEARLSLPLHYSCGLTFDYKTCHEETGTIQTEPLPAPIGLLPDILSFRPDVIISGEFGARSLIALLASRLAGCPLILWSEEILERAKGISRLQQRVRAFLISRASAFLAWGKPAADYISSWGISERRIYGCIQSVDNDFWAKKAVDADRTRLRAEWHMVGKVFLSVGRLLLLKGNDLFLKSWSSMPRRLQDNNHIVIVGSGAEEPNLRKLAAQLDIPNILFAGHKNREELAKFYALADVFVLPSLVDVWGLVVNEAMACGLPVIGSRFAGAVQELVADTGAGDVIDPRDRDEFAAVLSRWCTGERAVSSAIPLSVVSRYTFAASVEAIKRAISERGR